MRARPPEGDQNIRRTGIAFKEVETRKFSESHSRGLQGPSRGFNCSGSKDVQVLSGWRFFEGPHEYRRAVKESKEGKLSWDEGGLKLFTGKRKILTGDPREKIWMTESLRRREGTVGSSGLGEGERGT